MSETKQELERDDRLARIAREQCEDCKWWRQSECKNPDNPEGEPIEECSMWDTSMSTLEEEEVIYDE